jgi:hypothetical protein
LEAACEKPPEYEGARHFGGTAHGA